MPIMTPDMRAARALIMANRPATARDGYPVEVRQRVIHAAAAAMDSGQSIAHVASALGLVAPTLRRWLEDRDITPVTFRPVEVDAAPPASASPTLTLTSPGGWRVEGLDLDSLATLLGRLA